MIKSFTYKEEKDGKVAEYCTTNPEFYRRNYPNYCEILTGDDIPKSDNTEIKE